MKIYRIKRCQKNKKCPILMCTFLMLRFGLFVISITNQVRGNATS